MGVLQKIAKDSIIYINDKEVEIEIGEFTDCLIISKKTEDNNDEEFLKNHIKKSLDTCGNVIKNGGEIRIFKTIEYNGKKRYLVNRINNDNEFNEMVIKVKSL